jgi:FecR protein
MNKLIGAILLLVAQAVLATPAGVVETVQFPAFLDRNGLTVPVSAGIELQQNDAVRTGEGGRLLIRLAEGSALKLGQNAHFQFDAVDVKKGGLFQAAFQVLEGAFRFTTSPLAKKRPRNVSIGIAKTLTIGIRGTDLWGRGREDKDLVCLIDGKIEVTGNDAKTVTLDQPLQFFQSTRTAPPLPVAFLDKAQLDEWATETELDTGKGAATTKGAWRVVASGFADHDEAVGANRALRANGYPAEIGAQNTVQISGLLGELEAETLANELMGKYGITEVRAMK